MYDYMKSLQRQFFQEPACGDLRREIEQTRQELRDLLDKENRRKLLRLVACQDTLREEVSLHSFLAGYRLACGVYRELLTQPPHSFDKEEEMRAQEVYEIEQKAAQAARSEQEE